MLKVLLHLVINLPLIFMLVTGNYSIAESAGYFYVPLWCIFLIGGLWWCSVSAQTWSELTDTDIRKMVSFSWNRKPTAVFYIATMWCVHLGLLMACDFGLTIVLATVAICLIEAGRIACWMRLQERKDYINTHFVNQQ